VGKTGRKMADSKIYIMVKGGVWDNGLARKEEVLCPS
jgi:hypothetical protein